MAQILDFNKYAEDEDYLPDNKFQKLKEYVKELRKSYEIWYLVGCIYELFQEYILSEKQESILYQIVDPKEQFNDCWDYYEKIENDNPLMKFVSEV